MLKMKRLRLILLPLLVGLTLAVVFALHEHWHSGLDPSSFSETSHETEAGTRAKAGMPVVPERESQDLPRINLGLLTPVRGRDGGVPSIDDLSARYRELFTAFFPRQTASPKMKMDSEDGVESLTFIGPLRVTFDRQRGFVARVNVDSVATARLHAWGPSDVKELLGEEREARIKQMELILRDKLGINLGQAKAVSVREGIDGGRRSCDGHWMMVYHGYGHRVDTLYAYFEWQGSSLVLWDLLNYGTKVLPPKPSIRITARQAKETALVAMRKYRSMLGRGKFPPLNAKEITECRLAYVYRNDMYTTPDMIRGKFLEVADKGISHLCYVVRFDSDGWRIEVDIDSATGEVVGGEYLQVQPELGKPPEKSD